MAETTAKAAYATRPFLGDGADNWTRIPFVCVDFGAEFRTLADSLRYLSESYGGYVANHTPNANALAEFTSGDKNQAAILGKPFFKDTRLGANDSLNCLWQFNRDDDIVMPMMRNSGTDQHPIGEGMVYAETIEQNQTIAWVTFGVPKFTDLSEFFVKAFSKEMITVNALGVGNGVVSLVAMFGQLGAMAFRIVSAPLRWIWRYIGRFNELPVDRFFDLRTTMPLYYEYVDSILAHWLVNTGLYGNGDSEGTDHGASSWTANPQLLPLALRETGPSIWDIVARKARMIGDDINRNIGDEHVGSKLMTEWINKRVEEYDNADEQTLKPKKGFTDNPFGDSLNLEDGSVFKNTAYGATQFIGFRIEKSVDSSESFSNSTGPSPIAEKINSAIAEKSQSAMNQLTGGLEGANLGGGIVQGALNGLKDIMTGVSDFFGLSNLASAVIGGAFVDIPDQYKGSDYNKSHSLSFQLRSPYGDITSIYQSIIVPLACLLAGALPRAGGANSYVQPFYCRWYCAGMFSIPMGIIDSISIKRGSSEFGWTYQNLPTCVDVSISIKDLSPMMYMAVDNSAFEAWLGANNSWQEYLLTLSGAGLFERVNQFQNFKRRILTSMHRLRNQYFNRNYYEVMAGESSLAKAAYGFTSRNRISHR